MCDAAFNGHKTQVCTVGDLKPGQQFRTPNGDTILVTDGPGTLDEVATVNIRTGRIATEPADTRLGTDRQGRLYASTFLNGWYCDPTDDEQVCLGDDLMAPPPAV